MFVLDHVGDKSGQQLWELHQLYEFPAFTKTANFDEAKDTSKVAVGAFADPNSKRYPCHTKLSTWLSALYFTHSKQALDEKYANNVDARLEKFAKDWGLTGEYRKIKERKDALEKEATAALTDADFAYVWRSDDNKYAERRYPLRNAAEVKKASDWFAQYYKEFPFKIRATIAERILEKAADYGAAIATHVELLEKQAGHGIGDIAEITEMVRDRVRVTKDAGLKSQLVKVADTVSTLKSEDMTTQTMLKLAEVIDTIDRAAQLNKIELGLEAPEDVIFRHTFTKTAKDVNENCVTQSGRVYNTAQFRDVSEEQIKSAFGPDFLDQVSSPLGGVDPEKMAELVRTLPRPEAETLDEIMAASAQQPQAVKAAAAKPRLNYAQIAARYTRRSDS